MIVSLAGMGYTHYYRYVPNHPRFRAGWPRMVADAQRIVDWLGAAGVVILGFGDVAPVSAEGIALGGDYTKELTGEPFVISPTLEGLRPWNYDEHGIVKAFCKTERYPYDLAVTAILLRCHSIAPEAFLLTSDGDWADEWLREATYPSTGLSTGAVVSELFGDCPTESPFTNFH